MKTIFVGILIVALLAGGLGSVSAFDVSVIRNNGGYLSNPTYTGEDVVAARNTMRMGEYNATYDLNDDGKITAHDIWSIVRASDMRLTGIVGSASSCTIYVVGDLDSDGDFDFTDLDKLISNGRCHPFYCPYCHYGWTRVVYNQIPVPGGICGDVDEDGDFDYDDLTVLTSGGRCAPIGCPWCGGNHVVYNQITRIV